MERSEESRSGLIADFGLVIADYFGLRIGLFPMIGFWEGLFKELLGPAAVAAAVSYMLQKFFETRLQSRLKDSELRLQNELQTKLFVFQTQFSLFHQKQADVIAEVYKRLYVAHTLLVDLTRVFQAAGQNVLEKKVKAFDAFSSLSDYFSQHRIFLDEPICEKMDSVLLEMMNGFVEFDTAHTWVMRASDSYERDETGLWRQSYKTISEHVPPLLKDLERAFRSLLSGQVPTIKA